MIQIFRHFDGLASSIERQQPPLDEWRRFIYCLSMGGHLLGSVDHFKDSQGRLCVKEGKEE